MLCTVLVFIEELHMQAYCEYCINSGFANSVYSINNCAAANLKVWVTLIGAKIVKNNTFVSPITDIVSEFDEGAVLFLLL